MSWDTVVGEVKARLPKFNDWLLREFRAVKMDQMADYLDDHFRNSVQLFGESLTYVGYDVLSPMDRIKYQMYESVNRGVMKINKNNLRHVRYKFVMQGIEYYLHVRLPYNTQGYIYLDDTKYFPLFVILEKLFHKLQDRIMIKVTMAPLLFNRRDVFVIHSTKGKAYREYNITVRIHQGSSRSSSKERPPLILYHLAEHGFEATRAMYGYTEKDFSFVDHEEKVDGYSFFKVHDDLFIKAANGKLKDHKFVRWVIAFTRIFHTWKKFTLQDLLNSTAYYVVVLGKYTNNVTNPTLLHGYASKHMYSYKCMLDPSAKNAYTKAGYPVNSMSDLLMHVWKNIDAWMVSKPIDLYNKKLGSLEPTLAPLLTQLTRDQYKVISANKGQVTHDAISKFMNRASTKNTRWFEHVCRANPTIINNNWLLSIGAKRQRSLTKTESRPEQSSGNPVPIELMLAHPSQIMVESMLSVPSSNPILSGTINPYLIIDDDGNIVAADWVDEIEHVYD